MDVQSWMKEWPHMSMHWLHCLCSWRNPTLSGYSPNSLNTHHTSLPLTVGIWLFPAPLPPTELLHHGWDSIPSLFSMTKLNPCPLIQHLPELIPLLPALCSWDTYMHTLRHLNAHITSHIMTSSSPGQVSMIFNTHAWPLLQETARSNYEWQEGEGNAPRTKKHHTIHLQEQKPQHYSNIQLRRNNGGGNGLLLKQKLT